MANFTKSHENISAKDVKYLLSLRSPNKTVSDIINATLHLLGAKTDSEKDHKLRLYKAKATMLKELKEFSLKSVTFSDLKYLTKLFKKYPEAEAIQKSSPAACSFWQWLRSVYEARPVYEYNGLKARLRRNPAWESFTIAKSEEEAIGENFNQWMTATREIINQIQPKDITEIKTCKVLNDKISLVMKAIGFIFGSKTPKENDKFATSGYKQVKL